MSDLLAWVASAVVYAVAVVPANAVKQVIEHVINKPPRAYFIASSNSNAHLLE